MSFIKNLCQIILHVKDMNTMVHFYKDNFNLLVKNPVESDDYSDQFWVEFDLGECSLCLHGGGDGYFKTGYPRFTFEVDDIKKARDHLISKGIAMSEIRSNDPDQKTRVSDGKDPEGFIFSIEQFLNN